MFSNLYNCCLESLVDVQWYLHQYPDVADSGISPSQHFVDYGLNEGRLPCDLLALQLEILLWQNDANAFAQLQTLLGGNIADKQIGSSRLQVAVAAIVLAKWYASWGDWSKVRTLMEIFFNEPLACHLLAPQLPWLLSFRALWQHDKTRAAELLQQPGWPTGPDKELARAMLMPVEERQLSLHRIWKDAGLVCVDAWNNYEPAKRIPAETLPLVSVIVPLFNSADTITTALYSLLTQTWPAVEILVVDDGSTDHSADIVRQLASRHEQIRLLQQSNSGAYVARNLGLAHASGELITVHDADDWSHPQKLELQVRALLQQPAAQASVSHWVRCTPQFEFQRWRLDDGWIYRNVSSLMFRRKVHRLLGFWDRVSVNADTEFYYRIRQAFGGNAVIEVLPGIPLALGRVHSLSLSQTSLTHLRTMYTGVRRQYHEAALAWQQSTTKLYLTAVPLRRPFAVPERICRGTPEQKRHNQQLLIQQSELFDAAWYLATYPEVESYNISAAQHYLTIGAKANLDPSPQFSTSGYRQKYQLAIDVNPLLHFIAEELDRKALWQPSC